MKLYKKIFDLKEIIGNNKVFTDIHQAEKFQAELTNNWNICKELWERDTLFVADITITANGVKKKLKRISYKDYCDHYLYATAIAECFYQKLDFSTNNVWENNRIW